MDLVRRSLVLGVVFVACTGALLTGQEAARAAQPRLTPDEMQAFLLKAKIWDELIQNKDRNGGNLLWTSDWSMWLIDHTRAFRLGRELVAPNDLARCDRRVLEGICALTAESLAKAVGESLTKEEQAAVMARRDLIVKHFDDRIAKLGENILFTF